MLRLDGRRLAKSIHWRNNGNGTFTRVEDQTNYTQYTGFPTGKASFGSMPRDYDNDGDVDLFEILTHGEGDGDGSVHSTVLTNTAAVHSVGLRPGQEPRQRGPRPDPPRRPLRELVRLRQRHAPRLRADRERLRQQPLLPLPAGRQPHLLPVHGRVGNEHDQRGQPAAAQRHRAGLRPRRGRGPARRLRRRRERDPALAERRRHAAPLHRAEARGGGDPRQGQSRRDRGPRGGHGGRGDPDAGSRRRQRPHGAAGAARALVRAGHGDGRRPDPRPLAQRGTDRERADQRRRGPVPDDRRAVRARARPGEPAGDARGAGPRAGLGRPCRGRPDLDRLPRREPRPARVGRAAGRAACPTRTRSRPGSSGATPARRRRRRAGSTSSSRSTPAGRARSTDRPAPTRASGGAGAASWVRMPGPSRGAQARP